MSTTTSKSKSGGALAHPADRTRSLLATVSDQLSRKSRLLEAMLPRGVTPERLRAFTLVAVQRAPRLQQCSVPSILAAVYECSRVGLDPDAVDCVILPYRGQAQFQLMYRGAMKLARRAGVAQIWADTVREADHFVDQRGMLPSVEHAIGRHSDGRPYSEDDRGALIAAYACARHRDGFVQPCVVYCDEIERAKKHSKTSEYAESPWRLHAPAMWAKTAILRLCKLLPMPDDANRVLALDEQHDAGVDQQLSSSWEALPYDDGPDVTDVQDAAPTGDIDPPESFDDAGWAHG